jgi:hypothetical protein
MLQAIRGLRAPVARSGLLRKDGQPLQQKRLMSGDDEPGVHRLVDILFQIDCCLIEERACSLGTLSGKLRSRAPFLSACCIDGSTCLLLTSLNVRGAQTSSRSWPREGEWKE